MPSCRLPLGNSPGAPGAPGNESKSAAARLPSHSRNRSIAPRRRALSGRNSCDERCDHRQKQGDRRRPLPDRASVRQGRDHAPRRATERSRPSRRSRPAPSQSTSRSASAASRVGRVVEIYGPESVRQDDPRALGRGQAQKRGGTLRRSSTPSTRSIRSTRPSSGVDIDEPPRLSARHRRAGARDRRDAGALECARHRRRRLGGGTGAACRARGRDGRRRTSGSRLG